MIDRQKVRDGLAERLKGWEKRTDDIHHLQWWHGSDYVILAILWRPDVDWGQCGIVVKAMQEANWCYDAKAGLADEDDISVEFWTYDDDGNKRRGFAQCDTFPQAVCLAAVHALDIVVDVEAESEEE